MGDNQYIIFFLLTTPLKFTLTSGRGALQIQLRIVPDKESGLSEVRFWQEDELLGIQKVKNSDLNLVQF